MKEKAFSNARGMRYETSSSKILLDSLHILKFNSKNIVRKISFVSLEVGIAIVVACQDSTILLLETILELIVPVMLAMVAIVFTGYAFFQALINDSLLLALLAVDPSEEANLYNTNKYYADVTIYQVACLVFDLLIQILLAILPGNWCLFYQPRCNEMLATLLIFVVLHLNIEGIWEMKSFIFNVFQLFNLHALTRVKDMQNKSDEDD